MKKIKVLIFIALLLFSVLFACSDDIGGNQYGNTITESKVMGIEVMKIDDYTKICVENEQTTDNIIGDLYINDIQIPYDSENNVYYITVASGDNLNKYKLTHSAGTAVSLKILENTELELSLEEIISAGKNYKLFAYNNTQYLLCRLIFTYMPVMTIDNSGTVVDYNYPITPDISEGFMTLTDAGTKQKSDILINVRGGSSRAFPKVSYKMNLVADGKKNDMNLLGMRNDDDWVLLAIYTDESKIRDRLSYDLWSAFAAKNNNFGLHNGPQIKYIELILNGRYWGLYGLVVPVDKKQQKIDDVQSEILCKIESWEIPKAAEIRESASARSVDSIFMKHPDEPDEASWNIVADLVGLIFESDDDVFMKEIAKVVDIDNVLDYWILVNVISGEDNGWKNMFMTFKRNYSGYTALLCPWDCDLSWGVTWDADAPLFWQYREKELTEFIGAGVLPNRIILSDVNGARKKLSNKWRSLRRGVLSDDALINRVSELTDELKSSGTWDREVQRWPSGGHVYDDNGYIKNFIKGRMKFLDDYIEKINR
ncbi:MAG: CotH kinase family protein [Eubacteriales bacterium]|jgi:hypothetical protein|nr:CotH kinase family protein [Eubacteriales bacterium]